MGLFDNTNRLEKFSSLYDIKLNISTRLVSSYKGN